MCSWAFQGIQWEGELRSPTQRWLFSAVQTEVYRLCCSPGRPMQQRPWRGEAPPYLGPVSFGGTLWTGDPVGLEERHQWAALLPDLVSGRISPAPGEAAMDFSLTNSSEKLRLSNPYPAKISYARPSKRHLFSAWQSPESSVERV